MELARFKDGPTGTEIEVMDKQCYLLRNFFSIEEQIELFDYIQSHDRTDWNAPRALYPTPKTLRFRRVIDEESSEDKNNEHPYMPHLNYKFGQKSVVTEMISKANEIIRGNIPRVDDVDLSHYKNISMAAIQYDVPNGRMAAHIDHCQNSFVCLMSLGCTANFMVKGPNMGEKRIFKFNSGDLLVFNASTEAAILHEVVGIVGDNINDKNGSKQTANTAFSAEQISNQNLGQGQDYHSSCPMALGNRFPILQKHRYGVQCRVYF